MGTIEERLVDALGSDAVLTGEDARLRSTGWGRPEPCKARAVVRPSSTEEVSAVLSLCSEFEDRKSVG